MRTLALLALMVGVAFAQAPDRPFPNHEQPPDGWFCHPALNQKEVETNAHACACRGMTMEDPDPEPHCQKQPILDEEGNPTGETFMPESAKCKVFCHASHCHCKQRCETT